MDNYGGDDKGSDGESDNNWAEDGSDVHEEYDDNGAKETHIKVVHEGHKDYGKKPCTSCGKFFSRPYLLKNHVKAVHEGYENLGQNQFDHDVFKNEHTDNFGSTSESLKPEDDSVEGGGDAAFRKWILRNKPESKFEFTPEQESYLERIFQVKKFINIFDIGKNKHALKIMKGLF